MRDWIAKDFGWKLVSLFLAVAIWLTVHKIYEEPKSPAGAAAVSTVTFDHLPVLIVSTAADVHNFRVNPTTVKVTASGPAAVMARLQASELRAVVDLTDIESARDLSRLVNLSAPPRVTLISVEPSRVDVVPPPKP
ncbi:MAG TPA: CdaR family protein [Candidatus Acidoferrum sp.]|nr:CdaR family protein [Candidatus Acidoferrum sp.]